MKMKLAITALTVGALASAVMGSTGTAAAAPSDPSSATDTVQSLQADGYKVILNKVGTAPLSQCTVTAVRPGREITQPATGRVGSRDPVQEVLYTTVYVDVKC